jgi:hypothetical protein
MSSDLAKVPATYSGMMAALDADSISLRPLSLRPGGANPFAGFAKGAGIGLKNKVGRLGHELTSCMGFESVMADHAAEGRARAAQRQLVRESS